MFDILGISIFTLSLCYPLYFFAMTPNRHGSVTHFDLLKFLIFNFIGLFLFQTISTISSAIMVILFTNVVPAAILCLKFKGVPRFKILIKIYEV